MNRTGTALLEFDPRLNKVSELKQLNDGLSVVTQIGKTLWVASDETTSLERLSLQETRADGTRNYREHRQFALADYIELPQPPKLGHDATQEADIEGLDYSDGYLWLVGSHSRVRQKPEIQFPLQDKLTNLACVTSYGNRLLLARIPMDKENHTLTKELKKPGKNLTAASLRVEKVGDDWQNELTRALATDEHLQAFLDIPGKDNGLDIEGLAVAGDRIFLGLRGPVLRGFAVILELEPKVKHSEITLKDIGPDERPYRKHFLQLGGLGIRDLNVCDEDMLILAGPTMELDAPIQLFRWRGGANPRKTSLVWSQELPSLLTIPRDTFSGYAEGMTLLRRHGEKPDSVLIVYDAANDRKNGSGTTADIFPI